MFRGYINKNKNNNSNNNRKKEREEGCALQGSALLPPSSKEEIARGSHTQRALSYLHRLMRLDGAQVLSNHVRYPFHRHERRCPAAVPAHSTLKVHPVQDSKHKEHLIGRTYHAAMKHEIRKIQNLKGQCERVLRAAYSTPRASCDDIWTHFPHTP